MFGDPNQLEVWKELDEYLLSSFTKENNHKLKIAITCIDSGYATQSVYGFVNQDKAEEYLLSKVKATVVNQLPIDQHNQADKE